MECHIKLIWDDESKGWYTESDDNLCITLEAASYDVLIDRVIEAAPDMLELNCGYIGPIKIIFETVRIENIGLVS